MMVNIEIRTQVYTFEARLWKNLGDRFLWKNSANIMTNNMTAI